MTDVILTAAAGYSSSDLDYFVKSLSRSGFEGTVVMFVVAPTPELSLWLNANNITVVAIQAEIPQINCMRYGFYRAWLREYGSRFHRVLLTDVRDVVFQSHPFEFEWTAPLVVTLEDQRHSIASCSFNSLWMRAVGRDMLEKYGDRPISCSGTTLGTREAIQHYLDKMVAILENPPRAMLITGGVDQGIHNFLLWSGQLAPVAAMPNLISPVYTMGYVPSDEIRWNEFDQIIREDGSVYPVIHQYDRHPEVGARWENSARVLYK